MSLPEVLSPGTQSLTSSVAPPRGRPHRTRQHIATMVCGFSPGDRGLPVSLPCPVICWGRDVTKQGLSGKDRGAKPSAQNRTCLSANGLATLMLGCCWLPPYVQCQDEIFQPTRTCCLVSSYSETHAVHANVWGCYMAAVVVEGRSCTQELKWCPLVNVRRILEQGRLILHPRTNSARSVRQRERERERARELVDAETA